MYINTEIVLIAPLLCHGIYKYRESLLFHCYVMLYINTESPYCSTVMSWYIYIYKYRECPYCSTVMSWYIYINTEIVLIVPLLCHVIYKYRESLLFHCYVMVYIYI